MSDLNWHERANPIAVRLSPNDDNHKNPSRRRDPYNALIVKEKYGIVPRLQKVETLLEAIRDKEPQAEINY